MEFIRRDIGEQGIQQRLRGIAFVKSRPWIEGLSFGKVETRFQLCLDLKQIPKMLLAAVGFAGLTLVSGWNYSVVFLVGVLIGGSYIWWNR